MGYGYESKCVQCVCVCMCGADVCVSANVRETMGRGMLQSCMRGAIRGLVGFRGVVVRW